MWRVVLCLFLLEGCAFAQGADAPVKLSSGVVAGNLLSKPAPPNLCSFHANGAWIARVAIDENGNVVDAEMVNRREGDAVYVAWVRQFRYKYFQQGGRPIRVTSTVTVNVSCERGTSR
ncbi:energy transducer TonB [Terriglobus aquaticus]|uniref:TonB C-terminal domain-containing protein n=1 Tax=Terriglobus aquaticus TaxID=940139 RepID=A0ABW9KI21_9BACT|nr:hypothetical protein [Terriglobus aquaticus]